MKKFIVFILMVNGLVFNIYAQQEAKFYRGKCFKGYIFDSSYLLFKSIAQQKGRTQLSSDDIDVAEKILKMNLTSLNNNNLNQSAHCPNIEKNYNKYVRQYFGFFNKKGEKIVWINFFLEKEFNKRAKYELISVSDGCSNFWNVEINITQEKVSNLKINGSG